MSERIVVRFVGPDRNKRSLFRKILRSRIPAVIGIAVLLLISGTISAFAAETDASGDRNVVRMGYFEFGEMFAGASEDERKSGYCYDYMMHISTYTGWLYEFCYGSYAELYEKLRSGEIDILPYTNYNDQRGQEVLFADKVLTEEEYYIAVKPGLYEAPSSLGGAVISTLEGADYNDLLLEYIAENQLDLNVRYYRNLEETWDALRSGEADATVFTSNAYNDEGWICLCSFGKKPTYIAVAKDRPDLLEQINEAAVILDVDSPALMGELYAEYFSDSPMRRNLTWTEQQWISEREVLRVGGFVNDAPYIFSVDNETKTASGLTVDVVNGILQRLGLSLRTEFTGYNSLQEMEDALDTGEIDLIIPFYPSYDLAQQHNLVISNTVRVSNMELVYRKDISEEEALKTIATPATKLGIFYVQDTFPQSEIVGAVSIQDAVDRVLRGEATGAIAQNVVMHNIVEKYNNLDYSVLAKGCGTCFATRPENYPLIRILNRGLNFYTAAEISAISSLYTLEPNVTTMAYLASHTEAVIVLIVVFVFLTVLALALLQVNHLKQKADQASSYKTRFLFNMSHDIRTPMNAIIGFTKMASRNIQDTDKVRECLEKIDFSGNQLLMLVNQILEMSRIEAGKIELEEEPVDMEEEFRQAVAILSEQAKNNGLKFHSAQEELPHKHVLADIARLNSIMLNITGNAMKYTPGGGNIDVRLWEIPCRREGYASFILSVADTGIGMSKEYLKVLFEPFTRENSSTVSRIQGAGLGMSIVKSLVDLMGGHIEVHSEPGKGTCFDVTVELKINDKVQEKSKAPTQVASGSFAGCRVLLVEDNELNREIATDLLTEEGCEVTEADDGTRAVELVKTNGPDYYDYILMDIQMPVMNGYEATKAIRNLYPGHRIRIIALSANAFAEDRAATAAAGMDGHVAKPIDVRELFECMEKLR